MSLYDLACCIASFLLMITAASRLNAIKRKQKSKRWWFRRIGLSMVFTSMAMFLASYVTAPGFEHWDDVRRLIGLYGFLIVWITTPATPHGMPPWNRLIMLQDLDEPEKAPSHGRN